MKSVGFHWFGSLLEKPQNRPKTDLGAKADLGGKANLGVKADLGAKADPGVKADSACCEVGRYFSSWDAHLDLHLSSAQGHSPSPVGSWTSRCKAQLHSGKCCTVITV